MPSQFSVTPRRAGVAFASTAALVLLAAHGHTQVPPAAQPAPAQVAPRPPAPPTAAAGELARWSEGFADVAAQVLPAVVSIRVEVESEEPQGIAFGFPGMPFGGGGGRGPEIQRGTGSGIIVRADGVIITNNHVVDGARRITVHLRNGRTLPARVLGTDPATDLAVIQINGQNLPVARWADSETARVGEWVLAIGAPFGLEETVTQGVLSAKGRAGLGANAIEDYLQTDASINPGNSGGALVNLHGEVLGINTMIIGRGTGIGFAVPSRIARLVVDQVTAQGHVSRGWMGVGLQDLTVELAQSLNAPQDGGALVSEVSPAGPGSRAGLREGDVITALDGQRVTSSHDVVREVTSRRPGARIELSVLRDGRPQRVALTTAARPDDGRHARGPAGDSSRSSTMAPGPQGLGMEVLQIPAQRAHAMGLRQGVVVTAVEPGGAADNAELRRGDIILRADQAEVSSPGDIAQAAQDGRAALLVRRGNSQRFVVLSTR